MQLEKSEELTYLWQVCAQETTFGDKKDCRSWPKDISSSKSTILISKREIETRADLQWKLRAKGKRKGKAKKLPKTTPREETAPCGQRKAKVDVEIRAHSSTNQTRKAKERDDHTEIRKVIEKVAGKSQSGTAKRLPCIKINRGSCPKREMHVIVGVFPNAQNSKLQRMQVRRQLCLQTHR